MQATVTAPAATATPVNEDGNPVGEDATMLSYQNSAVLFFIRLSAGYSQCYIRF